MYKTLHYTLESNFLSVTYYPCLFSHRPESTCLYPYVHSNLIIENKPEYKFYEARDMSYGPHHNLQF